MAINAESGNGRFVRRTCLGAPLILVLIAAAIGTGFNPRIGVAAIALVGMLGFFALVDANPRYGLAVILFFTPILPNVGGRGFLPQFRPEELLLLFLVLYTLIKQMRAGQIRFRICPFDWFCFAFICANFLSFAVGPLFIGKFEVAMTDYFNAFRWIQNYILFRLAFSSAEEPKHVRALIGAFMLGSAFTVLLGVGQFFDIWPARQIVQHFYFDPKGAQYAFSNRKITPDFALRIPVATSVFDMRRNTSSIFFSAAAMLFFFFSHARLNKRLGFRLALTTMGALSAVACLLAGSRTGFLAMAFGLGVWFVRFDRKWLFAGGAAIAAALINFGDKLYSLLRIMELFSTNSITQINTLQVRFRNWERALSLWRESPIFGNGSFIITDSYYFQILFTSGLLGLAAFAVMCLWLAFMAFDNIRRFTGKDTFLMMFSWAHLIFLGQIFIAYSTLGQMDRVVELFWLMAGLTTAARYMAFAEAASPPFQEAASAQPI